MAFPAQKTSRKQTALRSTVKDQSGAGKTKIGEVLRKEGQILTSQLDEAIAIQKRTRQRLGSILIRLGYIEDDTIVKVLSRIHNYPAVDIVKEPPNPKVFETIPFDIVKKYCALPLRVTGNTLQVTMAEPTDTAAVEQLQTEVKMALSVCVSRETEILEAYKKYYEISEDDYKELVGAEEEIEEEEEEITNIDDFGSLASEAAEDMAIETDGYDETAEEFSASDAPIIKLVNGMLIKAVKDGVSDVHIEPYEKNLQVRYRLDGSLFKTMNLPLTIKNALTSRVKILASLDITERRVPQDGRIKMRIGRNKVVDFRVSTLPTLYGESIVLRILDKSSLNVDLTKLGFEP
ncbi:MAG: Flp pilus assembly complex ATPase component TadA, partial [Desulfobulbaceae bacterium]|nr:Flp pilus assembly complex ATPase component TadA [Desulfobulbaceae bacterium]